MIENKEIKAVDKNGNEIKFPTKDINYSVTMKKLTTDEYIEQLEKQLIQINANIDIYKEQAKKYLLEYFEVIKKHTNLKKQVEDIKKQYNILLEAHRTVQKCFDNAIEDNVDLEAKLVPFQDPYFKGLSMEAIAELAKKSIRITKDNKELLDGLEKISEIQKNGCTKDERCSEFWNTVDGKVYACCNQCVSFAVQTAQSILDKIGEIK